MNRAWELPKREGGSGEMLGAAPRPHIPFDATSTSKDHYKCVDHVFA